MSEQFPWLPEMEPFAKYGGDWNRYEEALYSFFKQDFLDSKPVFRGTRLATKRFPISQGKEATFWHMISEGKTEDDRTPDFSRCERIRWPKPIIEHEAELGIKVWKNQRERNTRICIWLEAENYLIILDERKDYTLFWTAYLVERDHSKQKLQREFEDYWRKKASPTKS